MYILIIDISVQIQYITNSLYHHNLVLEHFHFLQKAPLTILAVNSVFYPPSAS